MGYHIAKQITDIPTDGDDSYPTCDALPEKADNFGLPSTPKHMYSHHDIAVADDSIGSNSYTKKLLSNST